MSVLVRQHKFLDLNLFLLKRPVMTKYNDKESSGLWVWIVIGIIIATIAISTLYYIGRLD